MTPWDGVCGKFHYLHSDGLLIDGKGSIFYMNAEGVPALWCAADRLRQHLHRLWNVTHGEAVENASYIAATGRNW